MASSHRVHGALPRGSIWYSTATCPRFPLESHDDLEMNLVLDGSGTVVAGGATFELRRGALVWLMPGGVHAITEASSDLVMFVGLFGPDLVSSVRARDRSVAEGRAGECARLGASDLERLSLRAFRLLRHRARAAEFDAELAALLLDAWQTSSRERLDHDEPHPAVRRAATLLTYSDDRLSLAALSKRVGLSPFHLSRVFHAHMGVTLLHYANHQRVQRFECLFGDGSKATLLDAALDAGFGSYSQFFRTYRAVTGWSPATHLERLAARLAPLERWDYPLGRSAAQ